MRASSRCARTAFPESADRSKKAAAFVEKQQGLIQVDEPRPNQVFFSFKNLPRFGKALQSLDRLPLLAISRGFVCEGLGSLIAHPELFEPEESFMGDFPGLFTQIEFQVDVGEIQMAQRKVISITGGFAGAPSSIEGLDGTAVLAAEVIEISDVVIRGEYSRAIE